jgi:hypothetical protein
MSSSEISSEATACSGFEAAAAGAWATSEVAGGEADGRGRKDFGYVDMNSGTSIVCLACGLSGALSPKLRCARASAFFTGDDGSICMELNAAEGDMDCWFGESLRREGDRTSRASLAEGFFDWGAGLRDVPNVETNSGTIESISFFEGFFEAITARFMPCASLYHF